MTQHMIGDITVDTHTMTVSRAGRNINLTRHEYDMLIYLLGANGRPVSSKELVDHISTKSVLPNTAEVYVKYLRDKLGRDAIVTRRGFGYLLKGVA